MAFIAIKCMKTKTCSKFFVQRYRFISPFPLYTESPTCCLILFTICVTLDRSFEFIWPGLMYEMRINQLSIHSDNSLLHAVVAVIHVVYVEKISSSTEDGRHSDDYEESSRRFWIVLCQTRRTMGSRSQKENCLTVEQHYNINSEEVNILSSNNSLLSIGLRKGPFTCEMGYARISSNRIKEKVFHSLFICFPHIKYEHYKWSFLFWRHQLL